MIEVREKTIVYKAEEEELGEVNGYLLIERVAEEIIKTFPSVEVKKVMGSKKQRSRQIECLLPSSYEKEQVRVIKVQIELIGARILSELKEKIISLAIAG